MRLSIEMNKYDDKYYIDRVIQGDKNAFAGIVNKYKSFGMTIAVRLLRDKFHAEEALQDSFLNAYRSLRNFDTDTKFSVWFYRIVYNKSLDYLRSIKRRPPTVSQDDLLDYPDELSESIFDTLIADERKTAAKNAIDSLDEISSAIVTLYYLNECSTDEIAGITGLTRSNIKVILFRARKKMLLTIKEAYKEELEEIG